MEWHLPARQWVPVFAIAGFAILGSGTSVLIPLTFGAVGRTVHKGNQAGGMARFTTFTYAGIPLGRFSLAGSPRSSPCSGRWPR